MRKKGFYIIRCPQCGRYTFAPIYQKSRLCVYCQRIFKVNPLHAVYTEDAETARARVKFFQTGKHHKDFMMAIERSREKITKLLPSEKVDVEQLQEPKGDRQTSSQRRRVLEKLLYHHARDNPVDLTVFEKESIKEGLPWEWVVQQIEGLIRSGNIICPKPWQIQLVVAEYLSNVEFKTEVSPTELARRLGEIIQKARSPVSYEQLIQELHQDSVSSIQIDEALELLRIQGYVLKTSEGTFRWTGS